MSGVTKGEVETWNAVAAFGDHRAAGYLTAESDPLFSAAPAASIFDTDVAAWNEAHAWGDHAAAGYLLAETEPLFSSSSAAGIGAADVAAWNEAHGWGDHATAGYVTAAGLQADSVPRSDGVGLVPSSIRDDGAGVVRAGELVSSRDQAFAVTTGPADSADIAQSFTAAATGEMNKVSLYIVNTDNTPVAALSGTLRIYAGAGIAGTLLHTQPLSGSANGQTEFPLNTPVLVTSGAVYTMRFTFPQAQRTLIGNSYADGAYFNAGTVTAQDVSFETFVSSSALELRGDRVNVASALRLRPRSTPPANPVIGDLYVTSGGQLMFFNGSWKTVSLQ